MCGAQTPTTKLSVPEFILSASVDYNFFIEQQQFQTVDLRDSIRYLVIVPLGYAPSIHRIKRLYAPLPALPYAMETD
jgi:hypothetical protein